MPAKKCELLEVHLSNTDRIPLVIIVTGSENLRQPDYRRNSSGL